MYKTIKDSHGPTLTSVHSRKQSYTPSDNHVIYMILVFTSTVIANQNDNCFIKYTITSVVCYKENIGLHTYVEKLVIRTVEKSAPEVLNE